MSRLTVPLGPLAGGASATPPAPVDDGLGRATEELGARIFQAGQALEADRLQAQFSDAYTTAATGLADLRVELEREQDPDRLDAAWSARAEELKSRAAEGLDERNRQRFASAWASMSTPVKIDLGRRSNDLRGARALTQLSQRAQADAGLLLLSRDERAKATDEYATQLAGAVALGQVPMERVPGILASYRADLTQPALRRLLSEDPARLVAMIDAGEFEDAPADLREQFRASAASAVRAQESAAATAAAADRTRAEARADQDLEDLIAVAELGGVWEREAEVFADPLARERPGYFDAYAVAALRDEGVPRMTPAQMREHLAGLRAQAMRGPEEAAQVAALEKMIPAAEAAWRDDPIAKARAVGLAAPSDLPPDLSSPSAWATALRERGAIMGALAEAGYVQPGAFAPFTADERERLGRMAGVEARPEDRAALAEILARSFPAQVHRVFGEVAPDDRAFAHVGQMLAGRGSRSAALSAFRGAQAIKSGAVALPTPEDRRAVFAEVAGDAMRYLSGSYAQVLAAADAIYGEVGAGIDPKDSPAEAREAYKQAIQRALGRAAVNARSDAGGIQEINGRATLLPLGLTAPEVSNVLRGMRGPEYRGLSDGRAQALALEALAAASVHGGAAEFLSGDPLAFEHLEDVTFVATSQGSHRVQIKGVDLVDAKTGGPFEVSLQRLVSEARQRAGARP
ncbi:hypothetical protein [Albimonas pacifica]|uniref:Uncharacterized protein n=1 Tax=Albimonas pacifica TaxID=1114924 RepID=A0A1I3JL10_9RHOB|nr:hypothetical protein [Albimonas pacifica]SFI60943.1 hypothetical protein SAMN05216258_10853 [Albimonas pacifica]